MLTVSWMRAYHTRTGLDAASIIQALGPSEGAAGPSGQSMLTFEESDDLDLEFFDLQALRSRAFATGVGAPFHVVAANGIELHPRPYLLAHSSGFLSIRFTADLRQDPRIQRDGPRALASLERAPWVGQEMRWEVGGTSFTSSLRGAQNFVFFNVIERLLDRPVDLDELAAAAEEERLGNERINRLCRDNEMSHPFPVTFGTHIELDRAAHPTPEDEHTCFRDILSEAIEVGALPPEAHADAHVWERPTGSWYLLENQSLLFRDGSEPSTLGVHDPQLVQLLEFLLLRRASLRSIQRDTQRILTSGSDVSRRRIDEWRLLLATTTDDYVLHDQVSHALLPAKEHLRTSPLVRDLATLEDQVRTNIDSFQARIDLASQSASTIIGSLFAVVAVVIGFGSVLKTAASSLLGTTSVDLPAEFPWLNSGIDITVSFAAFAVTWVIIKRAGERLPGLSPYRTKRSR